jgi:hypothetical protein
MQKSFTDRSNAISCSLMFPIVFLLFLFPSDIICYEKFYFLLIFFLSIPAIFYGQVFRDYKKRPALGFYFLYNEFSAPYHIRTHSLGAPEPDRAASIFCHTFFNLRAGTNFLHKPPRQTLQH